MDFLVVYEHWRPDKNTCFYVGKGKLKRAKTFEYRNDRYKKIVEKLHRLGLEPEVKIVASGLTDQEAIAEEIALIRSRRDAGCDIANYTDGGDGQSGRRHSDDTRRKIAKLARGRIISPETRKKMAAAHKGSKKTIETRAKQSASAKIAQKARFDALKQTKKGRKSLKSHMIMMSRKAAVDPILRAKRSENAKALWANPAYREKLAGARWKHAK